MGSAVASDMVFGQGKCAGGISAPVTNHWARFPFICRHRVTTAPTNGSPYGQMVQMADKLLYSLMGLKAGVRYLLSPN
jgi:hypothetical protein